MAVLQDLFHHIRNLSQVTLELYLAPWECYDDIGSIIEEKFA